jgi:hypothetical protein
MKSLPPARERVANCSFIPTNCACEAILLPVRVSNLFCGAGGDTSCICLAANGACRDGHAQSLSLLRQT